jgi:hypothetical protein
MACLTFVLVFCLMCGFNLWTAGFKVTEEACAAVIAKYMTEQWENGSIAAKRT